MLLLTIPFKSSAFATDNIHRNIKTKTDEMSRKAKEISVDLICSVASGDVGGAIKDYLKAGPGIDMVLLSPTLAGNKKILDNKKLMKYISKPIVNITMPVKAAAYR